MSLFAAEPAQAAPLLRGFGGPAGYGTGILAGNDDGSSPVIDLTSAFPDGLRFFGGPYTRFYVNNNGNITFNAPVYNFTPIRFPIAAQPMIAPYWADVDTRSRTGLADPSENLVYWHLEPGRLIVTWHNVGYFSSHNDLRMDFQLVITNTLDCGSGDFDVEFRYNRCEWTTGDASDGEGGFGGTPAQAGFDAGNTVDFVEMPGSFTMAVLDVCTTSNIGLPGVWQFSVRSGGVVCPDAGMPCEVPDAVGPCAVGRTQCIGREIECQPVGTANPESCDGVDNDCDGAIDDGDSLCSGLDICTEGTCVPPCFEGGCADGYTCDATDMTCVETSCIGVECPADERCEGGTCRGACEGIVCPHGQACISGSCTDPCAAVTCDAAQTCRDGICIPTCPCLPCGGSEACGADGTCTPRGCDIVICEEGDYCEDGICHDGCEGVVCPTGQRCELAECVSTPLPVDAGPADQDAGVEETDAGMDGTMDAGATPEVDAGRGPPPVPRDGCGCRVAPSDTLPSWGWVMLGVVGIALGLRRRR
ncbi:MAG: MYXO-CTERM sorting domain-containing protein [Myxococcota bacterium]|nr:MYXO-CTERM sorting domain-containing protein [Myxococcota bacterium]